MNLPALCWVILLLHAISSSGLSCGCEWPCDAPAQQDTNVSGTPSLMDIQKPAGTSSPNRPGMGQGMPSGDQTPNLPPSERSGNRRSRTCGQGCQERTFFDMSPSLRCGKFRGYRRLSRDNLTEQTIRGAIYRLIQQNPGIDTQTVTDMTGANPHTVRYHMVILVTRGRIFSCRIQGRNRYYIDPEMVPSRVSGSSMISEYAPTAKVILSCITAEPGISRGEVALCASISGPSATRWLQRLAGAGLIVPERDGKHVRYYPAGTRD